ncbi:unnamed protein product, partial [Ectocarpus fasciculatus]
MQEMAAAVLSNMRSCTGEESTASPGDGTGLDPKEGDDAANEEGVGTQEAEAQGVDADPPTLGVV